tara:strand:+ start:19 stop:870 length:852 start_codon:yes stop_codon:yes gene_type:complete
MVKRQSTLKKKVSKRQTRKFSKKGGRKSMKKPASKQRKLKGGLGGVTHDYKKIREQQKEREAIREEQKLKREKAEKLFNKLYPDGRMVPDDEATALLKDDDNFHGILTDHIKGSGALKNVIRDYNANLAKVTSNKLKQFFEDCNQHEGKTLLKTPNLGRDYIKSKFSYTTENNNIYLNMNSESGNSTEVRFIGFLKNPVLYGLEVYSSEKEKLYKGITALSSFEADKKGYETIKEFIESEFKGKADYKQFLRNVLEKGRDKFYGFDGFQQNKLKELDSDEEQP